MNTFGANLARVSATVPASFPAFGVYVQVTAPPTWDEDQVRRVFTRLLRVDGWPLELVAVTANRDSEGADLVPKERG